MTPLDYTYTLQGWLKAINNGLARTDAESNRFPRDLFGMRLDYFTGDFQTTGVHTLETAIPGLNNLYNGNIAAWSHVNRQIDTNILGQAYRYDALNRLTRAQTYTGGGATAFLSKYRYDQGGNMLSLKRHDATGTIIDSMAYLYTRNADGELVHNRLNSVNDLGTAAGMPTGTSAYTYDRDGRLARDVRENLRLRWTVDNKLRGATNGNREVRYWYDATGQRVMKRLHGDTVEYIVRDGGGNELERVTRRNNTTSPILVKAEANLMGSGRLGIHELPSTATADTMEQRASGRSQYELSDHLGNVRTTVGDVKAFTAINASSYRLDGVVRSANDHYPYGMPINSRSFAAANTYRFGFNTQEKSLELNSGGNFTTALFWEYDSRTGRRWNLDPKPVPFESGYATNRNNPIWISDPLGDFGNKPNERKKKRAERKFQEKVVNVYSGQTEPPIPVEIEPPIPEQIEPPIPGESEPLGWGCF